VPISLIYVLAGFASGLRSLTPAAILCWAAFVGWLPINQTKLAFIGKLPTVAVLTLLAVAELIADKLPQTPARTKPIGLLARIFTSGVCAIAIATTAGESWRVPAILGVVGAVFGTFAGYNARRLLVTAGIRDLIVAVGEDAITIISSVLVVSRFT
jgi:uncharacterized membrane protein